MITSSERKYRYFLCSGILTLLPKCRYYNYVIALSHESCRLISITDSLRLESFVALRDYKVVQLQ